MQEAKSAAEESGKVMPLGEHLGELRVRLVLSILVCFLLFCIAMFFSSDILIFLKAPLVNALPKGTNALHFTGPLDVFLCSMKVSFLTAVIFAAPVWIYQFWMFVEPALYTKEKKFVRPFIVATIMLFFAGVAFCFFWILPITLDFLIGMGSEVGTPIITVTDYISLLVLMIFGFGFVFETPVVLVLLASLGIVTADALAASRRYVIVLSLFIGAILTPPDPVSQVSMAIPLYLMYEISIVIIRFMSKKKASSELAKESTQQQA